MYIYPVSRLQNTGKNDEKSPFFPPYLFGFNGKENDNEVKGEGNQLDYGFRIYDPRIGKFLSIDPLTKEYPWYTPYQFAGNNPIWAKDLDGLEEDIQVGKLSPPKPMLNLANDNRIRYDLLKSVVDQYVEQVYAGQKGVDAEKQLAKKVLTTRSFVVKDNNGDYVVVINLVLRNNIESINPVLELAIDQIKDEGVNIALKKIGEKALKLTPFVAEVLSNVVGFVFQDAEVGTQDIPMKNQDPVDKVITTAQQFEARKNLKKDILQTVKVANSNYAPSESTNPTTNVKKRKN